MLDLDLFVNWIRILLSFFNTIVLLWLGLTVLLNAEERHIGILMASGGFLAGSGFFISHTALLVNGVNFVSRSTAWWFFIGMIPAIILPIGWYITVLWYSGFWTTSGSALRQRHQLIFRMIFLGMFGGLGLLVAKGYRTITVFELLEHITNLTVFDIPLDAWGYIAYVVFCVVVSLDAISRPAPSERLMGDQARLKARPWLIGASVVFLITSIAVAWVIMWTIRNTREGIYYVLDSNSLAVIGQFDLVITLLIAIAVVMVGQAITNYELFTGKTLPRQGLKIFWRRTIIFATGISAMTSTILVLDLSAIYSVLLTIILLTVFFALLSWRSYVERDRTIDSLRPFISSQRLYESLFEQAGGGNSVAASQHPFHALCSDVLDCDRAFLLATGAYAPFVSTVVYTSPQTTTAIRPNNIPTTELITQATEPTTLYFHIDPDQYDQAHYAIPLWSERGLIGFLLLGMKLADGLYTQEEFEIARTAGERLIDTQASTAIASRLMQLQRERMAQNLVIDQHSRRVLHDEVLPLIQTAMIALSGGSTMEEAIELMGDAHKQVSTLLHEMPMVATPDVARLGVVGALHRVVEIEFAKAFDHVVWEVGVSAENQLKTLPSISAETIFYAARETVRNAAKYARHPNQPLTVTIQASNTAHTIDLLIHDDGVGVSPSNSPSGHGIALHSTMMAVVGGSLAIDSSPDQFTQVTLSLPIAHQGA
ncbi:MAG: sensor histidine kinase [Candidatus Promineifilaceae bacterium]